MVQGNHRARNTDKPAGTMDPTFHHQTEDEPTPRFFNMPPHRLIALRVLLVSLYALSIPFLLKLVFAGRLDPNPPLPPWLMLLLYLLIFNLSSEGSLAIDRRLNRTRSWAFVPLQRLVFQLLLVGFFALVTLVLPMSLLYRHYPESLAYPGIPILIFLANLFILLIITGGSAFNHLFAQWKAALLHAEHLKHEKLKSDYRALQNQVNPHFLFNCLNVLISEIKLDPAAAETFARKLSTVYRYVLQSKNHELITLQKELDHVRAFMFLHQVRSGNALKATIDISDQALQAYLPPLTLQILVENAVKHTVMNDENPLLLSLETPDPHTLVVRNNWNPKQSIDSTGTGLSNIKARYALLAEDGIHIEQNDTAFIVRVPLLEVLP